MNRAHRLIPRKDSKRVIDARSHHPIQNRWRAEMPIPPPAL